MQWLGLGDLDTRTFDTAKFPQMTPALRRLVERNEGTDALAKGAQAEGLLTLREDGLRKARAGLTTLEEVLAATSRG